ncbi:MAG: methylenetetrahydrofolate reductase C-terminal domain-containing protein [Candidatus Omnitrophota bacterium]
MIITVQKSREDIMKKLEGYNKIFLSGCEACAATCRTGGKPELEEMVKFLTENGKVVTGYILPERGCILPTVKKDLRQHQDAINNAEAILVLCCGLGNQVLTEITRKWVIPGCDTLFLGPEWKTELTPQGLVNNFEEKCSLCGECILDLLGGLCPHTLCAKGILNGPCGGTTDDGKCEIGEDRACGWTLIYNRLKELGRLDLMKTFQPAKNWSKKMKPMAAKGAAV